MSDSSRPTTAKPLLSDNAYKRLKHSATIILPAISALYFALAQIWNLKHSQEVVGTIAAVNVFVGAVVSISTRSYNNSPVSYDGTVKLDGSNNMASIELHGDDVINKGVALFKVEQG